ncbi:hypothetical protein ACIQRS_02080 [Streptomyces termitum]|uniref:Uncharacterized protein n=2 Tax=Streptomyces termitum TaxID=67368 RepID=A0A918W6E1_9ACTN|nr:hypothetical protein [Streptomyces termitum]GHA73374.1 hypothetical protein GCM10010305_14830 [Streptomyces termitum]
MNFRKAASAALMSGVLAGGVVMVAAPTASAGIRCTTEIVGSEAVAHCYANDDPSALYSTYRVVATCIAGNNTYTFKKYGPWEAVGALTTSRVSCGARYLSVDFELRK